ncbi:ribonuclease Z [Microbulbifer sp. JMSA004]|uniref:ribonuclease Z n=1 Tax=unclassified Microbulbifer TaxID=2619833 RepID=UPI0024AE1A37|nr:ribonuclease Z [Microbulbifer sp. VAAF005]WHI47460.1 ribonuclease Z [Microbulbifer sp. VAAF005]
MEILFLGTSSGTPTKQRNVSGIGLLESRKKNWYLIDCGEGTQQQILHTSLSLSRLKAIFITHKHGDHCYGLPGLLGSSGMQRRTAPLTLIAPRAVYDWLLSTQKITELYIPFDLSFIPVEDLPQIDIGQFTITTTQLSHRVPSYAYSFTERYIETTLDTQRLLSCDIPKGPLWGKLKAGIDIVCHGKAYSAANFIQKPRLPRKITICGDNDKPELLKNTCNNSSVLVHESTYAKNMSAKASRVGHSFSTQIASFAESMSIPNLVLTHFSTRYQKEPNAQCSIEKIRSEAQSIYRGQLFLAEDFMHLKLAESGLLTHKYI